MQYKATYTRYANGQRRISGPDWLHANSFEQALMMATRTLVGLRQADQTHTYDIVAIEATGYHGVVCNGSYLFETSAELTARCDAKAE